MIRSQPLLRSFATMGLVLIGACGDATEEPGPTSVNGEVFGRTMTPRSTTRGISPIYKFVGTVIRADHHAIKISDFADTCEHGVEGGITYPGQSLYIDFFVDAMSADATVFQPGTFGVWLPDHQRRSVRDSV